MNLNREKDGERKRTNNINTKKIEEIFGEIYLSKKINYNQKLQKIGIFNEKDQGDIFLFLYYKIF